MKTVYLILLFFTTSLGFSQTLSPTVTAAAGDFANHPMASLSWSLGEVATETFNNGNYSLNQGFHQFLEGIIINFNLSILVFLEGPFSGSGMGTLLNSAGVIPLTQPFNSAPWHYYGTESAFVIPNPDVVDWILVELRDATSAQSATPDTRIAMQAGFLLKDGSVAGIDGSSLLQFNSIFSQQLFVIIWHRNHLGIMSANGVALNDGIYEYDFSTAAAKVHGGASGYKNIAGGIWGMAAGDADGNGLIDLTDKTQWDVFAGEKGYLKSDFNLNTQVNNADKNNYWLPNNSLSCQVPQ